MCNKIKVAHVIRVFSYGGAEISLKEILATEAFRQNMVSDLYILDHKKLGLLPQTIPNIRNVRHYKITTIHFFTEFIRMLKELLAENYDIIHMHLPVAGWMGIAAKLFSRKPKFIFTEHTLVSSLKNHNYFLCGLTYGFNDCVISVSHEVSEEIQKQKRKWFFKRKKAVTILNGINTEKFVVADRLASATNGELVVGTVARLRPNKRLDKWVEIAEEIHLRNKTVKFVIIGDGPEYNLLCAKVEELHLKDIIQLPGKTDNTLEAYRHIDVFLLTSDLEGLPLALMEAMSCGCVPVVNNVGGIKQLELNDTGFKFSEYNIKFIAGKILDYADQPDKYFNESLKAREFALKSFSLSKQAEEIVELYKTLLNN